MSSTTKRILLSCLVIGIAICLCISIISIGASGLILIRPQPPVIIRTPQSNLLTPLPVPTEAGNEGTGSSPSERPTQAPAQADIPPDIARQMDEIQEQVEELRGLQPKEPVKRKLMTHEELRQKVIDDFLKDYTPEEARVDAIVLSAFGLLESDFQILPFYTDLLTEQIAGFYDDKEKDMVIVQGEGFQGFERLTYSHEYTHALQDQNFDFQKGLKRNDEVCEKETERCVSIQALIEGDATALEIQWLTSFGTRQDILQIQEFFNNLQSPVLDSAPPVWRQDFTFPYQQGQIFVQHLIDTGGWRAVDAAFRNPPVTTEQILHPERYPSDIPMTVTLPDLAPTLGEAWREIKRSVMGEWYTYLILAQGLEPDYRLNDRTARQAAEGWGGDSFVVYYSEATKATVMVFSTVWDSVNDAQEFGSAFRRYANSRFGDPVESLNSFNAWHTSQGYQTFRLNTDRTIWIQAVDSTMAESLWQALE